MSYFNYSSNQKINGSAGDDNINNLAPQVTIDGGSGNDYIYNNGGFVTINGGAGNDSIYNTGSNNTIQGGDGNDSINNNGNIVSVDGGAGNDTIRNEGSNNTILSGAGRDSIINAGSNVLINMGDDNDYINNYSSSKNTTLLGGSGNDIFLNWGNDNRVDGGAGNDEIHNSEDSKNATLIGGAGNDTIRETSKYGSTIDGGGGNDVVSLVSGSKNAFIVYHAGDGNDNIYGFSADSTLSITGGDFSATKSGNNIIVSVGDGRITLNGAATLDAINVNGKQIKFVDGYYSNDQRNVLVIGNDSANTINNKAGGVMIQSGVGNDSIYNSTSSNYTINNSYGYVTIEAGDGNDTIYSNDPYVSINGGAGNDSIYSNWSSNVTTDGGAGNDTINAYGGTVKGGAGNDIISLPSSSGSHVIQYAGGDGNDVIYGFRADSTLSLAGTGYISTKSGNDIILNVSDGKITLVGAATLSKVNIIETPINITNSKSNISVIGTNASDSIKNTGAKVTVLAQKGYDLIQNDGANSSLNGGDGNDYVINSAANVTINASTGNDTINVNKAEGNLIQYNNGDGRDVITGLSEKSSLSIGGANYASAKSGDNILVKVGDGIITIRGGAELKKLNVIGTADQSKTFNNSQNNNLVIGNALDNTISNSGDNVTIFANGGNDSIYNAWGADTITIEAGDGNDTIQSWGSVMTINAGNGNDYIGNHGGNNNKYDGGAGNDTIISEGNAFSSTLIGGAGNDYIRNDSGANVTINAGKGNDTLKNGGANAVFVYNLGDGDDVIEGFRADSTLDISGANYATEKSGNDFLVYIGDGAELTLKGAASLSKINIRGVQDTPKNISNAKNNTSMVGSNYGDTISNSGTNVTIMGNAGDDTITNSGANSSIDGSRGNDKIENSGASSIVEGGAGNDSIYNNRGDKSLVDGGAGNDTINNRATSATILGGDGNDSIWNGDYGNQLVLDGGAGNDTIKNTGSNNLVIGGAGNDYIDNSDNADNNNVTINAGTGNDSINNDSQNILFQYKNGDGNDVITGFKENSTLSINGGSNDSTTLSVLGGTKATTTKSGSDVVVTVGDGKITLKGAANLSKVNIVETPINFSNSRNKVTVNGANGNDTITNSGEKVAIFAQGGNDSIINNSKGINSTVDGGAGDDKISNSAKNVTLTGQGGNDSIYNNAANVSIAGADGNDSLFSNGENVSMAGGAGNDVIENYTGSNKAKVDGGAGDDSIDNAAHNVTIAGGDGNDTINSTSGTAVSIAGGAGNDVINVKGAYQNTITGGAGDDSIDVDWSSNGALIVYRKGDGNDVITGFNATSTLQIGDGSGTYSTKQSGDDIIVNVDIEKITLKGAAKLDRVNIAGRTKLNLNNTQSAVEILGSELNDSVVNSGFYVTLNVYDGHDTINNFAHETTIDAGAGDDHIENRNNNNVTIDGGAGADAIVSKAGFRNTITAGAGDDSIDVSASDEDLINYRAGDGNDYIVGFNETTSLRIAGEVFSTSKSNQDIIVTVGENKITLEGAASLSPLNILGVEDVYLDATNSANETLLIGTFFDDVIRNSGSNVTIAARDGNDSIHNGYWNENCGNVTIDAGAGNDTIINENSASVSIDAGEGNDYIENKNEHLTIKAGDGNDTIFNDYAGINSTIDGGAGNDLIDNRASNTTIDAGTGNDTIYNNWDIKKGVALSDDNDDGSNVLFNYSGGNDVIYGFKANSTLAISGGSYSTQKSGSDIIVTVGNSKITLTGAANIKKLNIAYTNTVNISNLSSNISVAGTGDNDLIANSGANVTIEAKDGNDYILNFGSNSSIEAGAGNDSIANWTTDTTIDGGAGADYISNSISDASIYGGNGADTIYNGYYGENSTLDGGADNDSIVNDGDNVLFNYTAGDGNDYIEGFRADSTLSISGGSYSTQKNGSDIIVTVGNGKITLTGAANLSKVNIVATEYAHTDPPVSIKNYDDKISVVGTQSADTIENYGTDVTILAGADGDLITNKALAASINGGGGKDTIINVGADNTVDGDAGNDSVVNYSKFSTIAAGDGDDTIENDRYGKSVSLNGGAGNDSIANWAADATIAGGIGNDTINLSSSSDNALIAYTAGDGNDKIYGFRADSTLSIAGGKYNLERTTSDIIVSVGNEKITLAGAATLSAPKIIGEQEKSDQYIENSTSRTVITGSALNDTIENSGRNVTIQALEGDDSIKNYNSARSVTIEAGAGNDTIENKHSISLKADAGDGDDFIYNDSDYSSINGGAGNDTVQSSWSRYATINGGAGNDSIVGDNIILSTITGGAGNDTIALEYSDEIFITYTTGDGSELIQGFNETATLSLGTDYFSSMISGNDVIVSVDEEKITLAGAATVPSLHIIGTEEQAGTYVAFTVEDSKVTYETDASESIIKRAYKFNKKTLVLTLNSKLEDYFVTVNNNEEDFVKVNWHYGKASLNSDSVLEYGLEYGENNVTLASDNYGDKISFDENATFHYGEIEGSVFSGSALTTTDESAISFDNGSAASIKAEDNSQIEIRAGEFTINDLPVKSVNGKGTITVEDGLKFEGYGVQFIGLEIAKESYFEKVTPMVAVYDIYDDIYAIENTACVKTLANDFTTLKFDFSAVDDDYAYYKVNDKEFLVANDEDDINIVEAQDSTFKIQGKEIDAKKISRVTIDEQISFKGTEIKFNDVEIIYAQGKTVSYTLDGEEITIDDAATVTTSGDVKTFNSEAGSYVINGRSFEVSAALTFTADESQIVIPLTNAATEIYFDGVTVSGVSDGSELVFDLIDEEIYIPSGATINFNSPDEVKLNLAAGDYTINNNEISCGVKLEIVADKDNIKIPLSEDAITINGAMIMGDDDASIDSNKIITLPDGALVENVSENIYKLEEENSAIFIGDEDKKVLLTDDGAAYIKYANENVISVGFNSVLFEDVEIYDNDAWTVETDGKNGVDKITGITDGAAIFASMTEGAEGDLNFDIETEGDGEFIICDQKFISTGDAENIFTVSKVIIDSENSTIAVTAITKKFGTVSGNFENGIQVNPEEDNDDSVIKATNSDEDIELELDSDGKLSVEKIEDGANVEKYGQAEKIITVKNAGEYTLQIGDYKYTVNGDLDDDGITFELVDGDFKVRTLYEEGEVTRYNVNDSNPLIWTWSAEEDKWTREQIAEDAPYEIEINADKTLTLTANGVLVNWYSDQVIASPASGAAVENGITLTAQAIDGTTTLANNSESTPNIFVKGDDSDDQIITALAEKASVQIDKSSFTLKSENATGTTFKIDSTRKTLKIADNFKVDYSQSVKGNAEIKLASDNNDVELSNSAKVTAPAGKKIKFGADASYTVNGITFDAAEGTEAETIQRGIKFDLSTGTVEFDSLSLEGGGTAQISQQNPELVILTDGAKVKAVGDNKFKYYNRRFAFEGAVEIVGKKFESDKQVRGGLIYFETSEAEWNEDGTYTVEIFVTTGFVVGNSYVEIQNDFYNGVKIVNEKISAIEGVKSSANIVVIGTANISIVTEGSGTFTIGGKTYTISDDSDGATFVTDSSGNVSEINGVIGTIEGDFGNAISVNGKAIQISGASAIKVATDGENITEITNVAGDLVTADGNTYRKDVRVISAGGAEKLTTSADGTIIFDGNKFETSAGKIFTFDDAGNVSEINDATKVLAAFSGSEEISSTMTLTTTDGLEEVIGDFSEGLLVNGVFVRVTDSTNFVVKNDAENIYVETTAADTFTINGKTLKTSADKTIFKLDSSGDVSEIVTDKFLPDEEAYLIEGDFSDEIIFEGQKFCVTGTNDTTIFVDDETLISVKLARNAVNVVESGGASKIAISGAGDITVGDKTFSTSNNFAGNLQTDSGDVYSVNNFVGTISGELGGLELNGITITSDDNFSVTGDGEKITAIDNLQNGSLTGGDLDGITINGEKISLDDSEEMTLTITDGKLKTADDTASDSEEILNMFTGDADKISVVNGKATIKNYDYKGGEAFITENKNIAEAIEESLIAYDDGRLTVNSAQITFAEDADSRFINFVDADDATQKVGFVSYGSKLDASKETGSLILVGNVNSTIIGGKGHNHIYLEDDSESTIALNGKNTIHNFNASFDYGDRISLGAANQKFSFDGENISVKSGAGKAVLQNVSSGEDGARLLTVRNGKETKTAIAQNGSIIAAGDDLADAYYGKKSGVDFSGYSESLNLDLSENFYGINRVTVGGGLNTLSGSSANETLTGNGDGITEYFFGAGGGRDLIQNFNFSEDRINVSDAVTGVKLTKAGNVRMKVGVGEDYLTIEDAQGKAFKVNDVVAVVDKNISYSEEINFYVATARNATLTVNESAEIWLDGSHDKTFVGVKVLDASNATGNTSLVGNDFNNTIVAGDGDASLWGGNGGDDLLIGGASKNTFFYTSGNDTVSGANDGDEIILSSVTLEQISGTSITADGVAINFADGGSLQVNGNSDVTYQLADGTKFSASDFK